LSRGGAEETGGRPGVYNGGEGGRKVGAEIDDPGYGAGEGRGREKAGAERGVGTRAAEDVEDGGRGRQEVDFIWRY
jgi:hypothetical protein